MTQKSSKAHCPDSNNITVPGFSFLAKTITLYQSNLFLFTYFSSSLIVWTYILIRAFAFPTLESFLYFS